MNERADHHITRAFARSFTAATKEVTGQGPERCRVAVVDEVVIVTVEGSLTEEERTMAGAEPDLVRRMRRDLQHIVAARAGAELESLTGGKVVTVIHDHAIEPDFGVYCFRLDREPAV